MTDIMTFLLIWYSLAWADMAIDFLYFTRSGAKPGKLSPRFCFTFGTLPLLVTIIAEIHNLLMANLRKYQYEQYWWRKP